MCHECSFPFMSDMDKVILLLHTRRANQQSSWSWELIFHICFWYNLLKIFAPSSSAWISLSVLIPMGLLNNHPSLSHNIAGLETSMCFSASTSSNWFLMSSATWSTSDCTKTCHNTVTNENFSQKLQNNC